MNRTTTVVVALIAAAGLTTMIYAVPGTAQQAFAWGHRVVHHNSYQSYPVPYPVPYPVFGGCGGCGGGFFVHKVIIQTINQVNNCTGNGEEQKVMGNNNQDQNQKDKQTICLNTAVNNAGRGLTGNGVGSGNLGNTGSGNLGNTGSGNLGNTGSGNLGNTGSGNLGQSDVPDNLLP